MREEPLKMRFSEKLGGDESHVDFAGDVEAGGDVVSVRLTEFGCRWKTLGRIAPWGSRRKEDAQ